MRLRPRRRNLVLWSSSGLQGGESWAWRPVRRQRVRIWLRIGTLLAVTGITRLARFARTRWEPLFLGVGALLMAIGFTLPTAFVVFFPGMLVLVVTLLKGIASKGRAADCRQWYS